MPPLMKVLLAGLAILAVIELVRGRPLIRWRRRHEHPLETRGRALYLVLFVASTLASSELHAFTLAFILLVLAVVVLLGGVILGRRERRL
jgi:hypothetical protein